MGRTGSGLIERFFGFMVGNGLGQRHAEHHVDLGGNPDIQLQLYVARLQGTEYQRRLK
jgi:hypothetical protein